VVLLLAMIEGGFKPAVDLLIEIISPNEMFKIMTNLVKMLYVKTLYPNKKAAEKWEKSLRKSGKITDRVEETMHFKKMDLLSNTEQLNPKEPDEILRAMLGITVPEKAHGRIFEEKDISIDGIKPKAGKDQEEFEKKSMEVSHPSRSGGSPDRVTPGKRSHDSPGSLDADGISQDLPVINIIEVPVPPQEGIPYATPKDPRSARSVTMPKGLLSGSAKIIRKSMRVVVMEKELQRDEKSGKSGAFVSNTGVITDIKTKGSPNFSDESDYNIYRDSCKLMQDYIDNVFTIEKFSSLKNHYLRCKTFGKHPCMELIMKIYALIRNLESSQAFKGYMKKRKEEMKENYYKLPLVGAYCTFEELAYFKSRDRTNK
jgi:hypothetical protein